MPRSREDKLRLVNELLASEGWQFFQEDLEEQAKLKSREIVGHVSMGSTNMMYLHHGIKEGVELALNRPSEIKKECESFFKKMNRVLGATH